MIPPPPRSTLFPYTTLFRSETVDVRVREVLGHDDDRSAVATTDVGDPGAGLELRLHPVERGNPRGGEHGAIAGAEEDRKSTRLNSSHRCISYAVFCLKKKKK